MDQCIPCVLRGSANLPAQLRFITTLLRRYRFRLHCVPLALRTARCVFASARMSRKLIPSAAQSRNRVGIRRRRTTPRRSRPRCHAPRRRLRSEMLAIFLLSYASPPIPNVSDIYARAIHFCPGIILFPRMYLKKMVR